MAKIRESAEKAGKETIENMAQGLMVRMAVDSADSKSFVRKIFAGLSKAPDSGLSMAASTIGHSVKDSKYFTPEIRELLGTFFIASAPAVAEWKRRHHDDAEGFANEAAMRWEVQRLDAGVPEWKSPSKPREPHLGTVLDGFTLDQERVYLKASAFALFERQGDHAHSKPLEGNAARTLMGMFEAARRAPDFAKRHIPTDKRTMRVLNRMRDLTNEGRRGGREWTRYAKEFVCRNWDLYENVLTTYIAENKDLEATDVLRAIQDAFDDLGSWAGVKKLIKIDELAEKAKKAKAVANQAAAATMTTIGFSLVYLLTLFAFVFTKNTGLLRDFAVWSAFVMYGLAALVMILGWFAQSRIWQGAAIIFSTMVFPPLLALAFIFATFTNYVGPLISCLPLLFLLVWDVLNWRLYNVVLNQGSLIASQIKDFLGGEEKAKAALAPFKESIFLKRIGVTGAMAVSSVWIIVLLIQVWVGMDLKQPLSWMQIGLTFAGIGGLTYAYIWSVMSLRDLKEFPEHLRDPAKAAAHKDLARVGTFRDVFIVAGILVTIGGGLTSHFASEHIGKLTDVVDHKTTKAVDKIHASVDHGEHATKKQKAVRKHLDCNGRDRNLRSCQ